VVIYNATREQIRTAAEAAGVEARWTGPTTVRLFPVNRQYGRVSLTGRQIHAVCFHGHYRFAEELFKRVPDAVIKSSMGLVTANNLELTWATIGDKLMGDKLTYRDMCECREE